MDATALGDAEVVAALARADAACDELLDAVAAWEPATCDEAAAWVRAVERLGRRGHAIQVAVQDRIGRSGVYKGDGHASAKVMVRHAANLSGAEAKRRHQVVRMQRDLPEVAAAHAAGRLGVPQVERIARVHANKRVADELAAVDGQVARAAVMLPYKELDAALADWERLTDEDGAQDRGTRPGPPGSPDAPGVRRRVADRGRQRPGSTARSRTTSGSASCNASSRRTGPRPAAGSARQPPWRT